MGSTGSASRKMWMLVGLLAIGALVPACTDNKGPAGPTFPAGQVGDPSGGALFLSLHPGPGADQFIVTVLVLSGNATKPAERKRVQLLTTAGSLSNPLGETDHDGRFESVLTCDGPASVTAISEGLVDTTAACGEGDVAGTGGTGTGTTTP